MRPLVPIALTLALVVGLPLRPAAAQQDAATRRHHPWGCFAPGAWKVVRVVTETLDAKGAVVSTSTTETKTTLTSVDGDGVTLLIEAVVEVAGKRLEAEPQCVRQGFHGSTAGPNSKVTSLGPDALIVEDRTIPCKVEQVEETCPTSKTATKLYFADGVAPYVLKRQSVTTDLEGKTTLDEATATVVALDLPWKVLAEIKSTALVHAVQKHGKGTSDTWAITCPDVPGGVVRHTSKQLDENGNLVRRSTLELVDYGREPDDDRTGLFPRIRTARPRKAVRTGR